MSKFTDFLSSRRGRRVFLVDLYPYNKNTSAVEVLRFSSEKFITSPTDSPPSTAYRSKLSNNIRFQQSMYSEGSIGGRSFPGFGYLELRNENGDLDRLRNYAFDGRRVVIRMGRDDFEYSDFGVVFDGTAESVSFTTVDVKINLRDNQYLLDVNLFQSFYTGSGAWSGSSELTGVPIPKCYGVVRNVKPVVVDPINLRYQVHGSSVKSITNVRDKGSPLTFYLDFPNKSLLDAAIIPSGNYATSLTDGVLKLGSSPSGAITCDCEGDNFPTYVSSASRIMERIITTCTTVSSSGLDSDSFSSLHSKNPASVGIYCQSDQVSVMSVLDEISSSIGAWYGSDRSGKITVGRLESPPSSADATFSESDIMPTIERSATAIPVWQIQMQYRKNFNTMSLSDLVSSYAPGGVNAGLVKSFSDEYRSTNVIQDSLVKTAHLLAREETYQTLLDQESDALAEGARRLEMEKVQRDLYKVPVRTKSLSLKLNDCIQVYLGRYGLDSGRRFVLTGIDEDLMSGNSILELWG